MTSVAQQLTAAQKRDVWTVWLASGKTERTVKALATKHRVREEEIRIFLRKNGAWI